MNWRFSSRFYLPEFLNGTNMLTLIRNTHFIIVFCITEKMILGIFKKGGKFGPLGNEETSLWLSSDNRRNYNITIGIYRL